MPFEMPPSTREELFVLSMAQEPSPTAGGLSETELIFICCFGFTLGYLFRWVSAAHTPVDMGYVLALLDTDGNGKVDKEEIAYAARLILDDKKREIQKLPNIIRAQETKVWTWEVAFGVSVLLCAAMTTWSYVAFGGMDLKVLLTFVPLFLVAMFCLIQLLRNRAFARRLRKRQRDGNKFIDHLKSGGREQRPVQPAMDPAWDAARLQEPFLEKERI